MELRNWRKPLRSSGNGGNCVETASNGQVIAVRDTKDRKGATLKFTPRAWAAFTNSIKKLAASQEADRLPEVGSGRPLPS